MIELQTVLLVAGTTLWLLLSGFSMSELFDFSTAKNITVDPLYGLAFYELSDIEKETSESITNKKPDDDQEYNEYEKLKLIR